MFNHGGVDGIPKPLIERAAEMARRGMSQKDLAAYLKISESELSLRFSTGNILCWTTDQKRKIAKKFRRPQKELFG